MLDLYDTGRETFKFWFGRFWAKTWKDTRVKSMPPVQLAALNDWLIAMAVEEIWEKATWTIQVLGRNQIILDTSKPVSEQAQELGSLQESMEFL